MHIKHRQKHIIHAATIHAIKHAGIHIGAEQMATTPKIIAHGGINTKAAQTMMQQLIESIIQIMHTHDDNRHSVSDQTTDAIEQNNTKHGNANKHNRIKIIAKHTKQQKRTTIRNIHMMHTHGDINTIQITRKPSIEQHTGERQKTAIRHEKQIVMSDKTRHMRHA